MSIVGHLAAAEESFTPAAMASSEAEAPVESGGAGAGPTHEEPGSSPSPKTTPKKKKEFSSCAWENATTAIKRPRMDLAKALGIMGFSSSRNLHRGEGHDPKMELNLALNKKMEELERKKKGFMGRAPPSGE